MSSMWCLYKATVIKQDHVLSLGVFILCNILKTKITADIKFFHYLSLLHISRDKSLAHMPILNSVHMHDQ